MLGFGRRQSGRRQVRGARSSFIPSQLTGNVLWLRADRGITLDGSNNVQTWADQSGSGNNFTQGTAANRPGYAPRGNNSGAGPALTFNGTAQLLTIAAALVGASNHAIFVVFRTTSTAVLQGVIALGSTAETSGISPLIDGAGHRQITYWGAGGSNDPAGATTNWEEWTLTRDTATGVLRVNGTQRVTNAAVPTVAAGSAIGAGSTGAQSPFGGSIDEVIAYNRLLTAAEVAEVEAYIRARTGIW